MKRMKRFCCVALCVILLCAVPTAALAVTQGEIDSLEERREELSRHREGISGRLEELEDGLENALERKAALDEESSLIWEDISLAEEQLELYSRLLEEKQEELLEARKSEQEHYERYCSRVRKMEEQSRWSYLSFVLSADSLSELLSRVTDISDIMNYDLRLREGYISACERAAEKLDEYNSVKTALEEKRGELRLRQDELEEKIAASAAVIADIEKDMESYLAYEDSVAEEMKLVQDEIDKKSEELRKQQEAEAAAKSPAYTAPGTGNVSSGYYMWPSATTYITSYFGPRVHPLYGVLKPHTGVDIGAWYGSEIYAAASGTVTAAVLDFGTTGYGSYVAIYHPNGSTTLYAHMSALAVSPGQNVTQGQLIGYVGSTGASNGPHIHFEIRQGGVCVDPMQYFNF